MNTNRELYQEEQEPGSTYIDSKLIPRRWDHSHLLLRPVDHPALSRQAGGRHIEGIGEEALGRRAPFLILQYKETEDGSNLDVRSVLIILANTEITGIENTFISRSWHDPGNRLKKYRYTVQMY